MRICKERLWPLGRVQQRLGLFLLRGINYGQPNGGFVSIYEVLVPGIADVAVRFDLCSARLADYYFRDERL
ncbi:hypothetical protein D3C77_462080 [compost metagenome]